MPFFRCITLLLVACSLINAQSPDSSMNLKMMGTPIVSWESPMGSGARDIEVIRDGIYSPPGGGIGWDFSYDTFHGFLSPMEAYFGYTFDVPYTFTKLIFTQGQTESNAAGDSLWGTFDGPVKVQVQTPDEGWKDVQNQVEDPPYTKTFPAFAQVTITFTPATGTGIRILGMEQEVENWVSCAELDVEGTVADAAIRGTVSKHAASAALMCRRDGNRLTFSAAQTLAARGARLTVCDLAGRSIFSAALDSRNSTITRDLAGIGGMLVARLELNGKTVGAVTIAQ